MDEVKRGELYYADLSPVVGSEQGGIRPVLRPPIRWKQMLVCEGAVICCTIS